MNGKTALKKAFRMLLLTGVAMGVFGYGGSRSAEASPVVPTQLLGDVNFANGFRAVKNFCAQYDDSGNCLALRDIGRPLTSLPNATGDTSGEGKHWGFEEGVHKEYVDGNGQYVAELFDHRFSVRYSNLQNTANLLSFENTNYAGAVSKRFTSDKAGVISMYFNTKNEIRNAATDYGATWAKDTWPHYLIEQALRQTVDLAQYDKIDVSLDAKLNSATMLSGWAGPYKQLTIPFYFYLKEKSARLNGGEDHAFWTGVVLYSTEPVNYDELLASDQYGVAMYHDDAAKFGGRLAVGETKKIRFDLKKLVAAAIKKGQKEGKYTSSSPDNYVLSAVNLGYEGLGNWETEVQFSNFSVLGYSTGAATDVRAWDYVSGTEGWQSGNNVILSASNGTLSTAITGSDPFIYSPSNLAIDASKSKYVRVRMKNGTAGPVAALYWITDNDTVWNENKAMYVSIPSNMTDYKDIVFDLSNQSSWGGTVKQLRIDQIDGGSSSGTVNIDYVRVSDDPHASNIKSWDFAVANQLEGWNSPNQAMLSVANGQLSAEIAGTDPLFFSPDQLGVDAAVNKYVRIKLRNNASDVKKYEFASGTEGWVSGNNVSLNSAGGVLSASITGTDSYMVSQDQLGLDASSVKYIRFNLKNNTPNKKLKVYFITDADQTWDEKKSLAFYAKESGMGFTENSVNMSRNSSWTGTIKQVRIDMDDNNSLTSGSVDFDFIRFSKEAWAAVYWTTNTDPAWSEAKSYGFKIAPTESGFAEYVLDLNYVSNWAGAIKQLRIDPINDGSTISGTVDIEYIRISR